MSYFEKVCMIVLLIFVLSVSIVPVLLSKYRRARVLSNGVAAKARIIGILDTGRRHNSNPVLRIQLVVTDISGHDFPAEVTLPVSPVRLVQYQPGAIVPVKYVPNEPQSVAIDTALSNGETK
jgi:hypothetical protein